MNPSARELAAATICPRCDGTDTAKTFYGMNVSCYVLGNGYLDAAGTRRDMNIYTLDKDDPYADMRQPGEVDELKAKFRRAGRKGKPSHFDAGKRRSMEKAVRKAISNPTPE